MRKQSQGETIPKGLPLREDQIQRNQRLKVIGKAMMPSAEELAIKHFMLKQKINTATESFI